ncbi:hypothetical protein [Xanthomonas campestris]|uniref:hypothetical protein n=1 Tax=Xanthomonas campestris TaxID=339 RepID=UPI00388F44E3
MTWLDVIDSAVKIGLGAVIAGISAFALSRSQHYREMTKAKVEREFQILKDVAEQTERLTQSALRYWSLTGDLHRSRRSSKALSAKKEADFTESKEALYNSFHELTSSEAKLLLLGKQDAQTALRTYGDMISSFRKSVISDSEPMSDAMIDTWRTNILQTRERLLAELHACYRDLGP